MRKQKRQKKMAKRAVGPGKKRCSGPCGKSYLATTEHFHRDKTRKDGFRSICKKCTKEYGARYNACPEIRARHKEWATGYYRDNRGDILKRIYQYQSRTEVKVRQKKQHAEHHKANRELCLDKYGHQCVWRNCVIGEYEFLAFDHPKNDGREHKKITGSGAIFINWLIENNFPKGIVQLLCHNHNLKKELERKRLIHKQTFIAIKSRKIRAKLKLEVLTEYSPNKVLGCACRGCDVKDIDMLTIDHIDGIKDKSIPRGGDELYGYLKNHGFPRGYRTLCANCNYSRGHYDGYCPHRKKGNKN